MCLTAILGVAGAAMQAGSASAAAKAQTDAANNQLELQKQIYDEQKESLSPYVESGKIGQEAYLSELGLGDRPEGYEGIQESDAFKYNLTMGRDATEAGAAGRGGLYSGSTLSALERFRQGLASNEVNTQLNRLAALGQGGANAAAMQSQAGTNYAQMGSTSLANMGNAQAAGAIGVGNAFSGGVNNLMGAYGYQNNLDTPRGGMATLADVLRLRPNSFGGG